MAELAVASHSWQHCNTDGGGEARWTLAVACRRRPGCLQRPRKVEHRRRHRAGSSRPSWWSALAKRGRRGASRGVGVESSCSMPPASRTTRKRRRGAERRGEPLARTTQHAHVKMTTSIAWREGGVPDGRPCAACTRNRWRDTGGSSRPWCLVGIVSTA